MVPKIEFQGSFAEERQWICPNCETVNTDQICTVCGRARPPQTQGQSQTQGQYQTQGQSQTAGRGPKKGLVPMIAAGLLVIVAVIAAVLVATQDRATEKVSTQSVPNTPASTVAPAPAAPEQTKPASAPEQATPTSAPREGTLPTAEELCTYVLTDNGWPASLTFYDRDSGKPIRSADFTYESGRIAKTTLRDSDGYAIMSRELIYDTNGAAIGHIATDIRGNSTRYEAGDQPSYEFYEEQGQTAEDILIWDKASQRDYLGIQYHLYGEQERNNIEIYFTPTGAFDSILVWENGSRREYNSNMNLSYIWDYAEDVEALETYNILMLGFYQNELRDVYATDGDYNDLPMDYNTLLEFDGAELCSLADYVLCARLDNPPKKWLDDSNHSVVLTVETGGSKTISLQVNAEHIRQSEGRYELWAVINPESGITASDIKKCSISLCSEGQTICTIS